MNPPKTVEDIVLEPKSESEGNEVRVVGKGFAVNKVMGTQLPDEEFHQWEEQWIATFSDAHAERQIK